MWNWRANEWTQIDIRHRRRQASTLAFISTQPLRIVLHSTVSAEFTAIKTNLNVIYVTRLLFA